MHRLDLGEDESRLIGLLHLLRQYGSFGQLGNGVV